MGLRPRDLAGVDGAVDQVIDAIPDEDLLMPHAGPRRVRQNADAEPALLQGLEKGRGVRVKKRRPFPLFVVHGIGELIVGNPGRREDLGECPAEMVLSGPTPQLFVSGLQLRRDLDDAVGLDEPGRDALPS